MMMTTNYLFVTDTGAEEENTSNIKFDFMLLWTPLPITLNKKKSLSDDFLLNKKSYKISHFVYCVKM